MDRAGRVALRFVSLLAAGCASSAPAAPAQQSATAATSTAASSGGEPLSAAGSLSGLWVEFWALQGHADTQRYALFEDGRFGWCAASAGAQHGERRWGRWSAEGDVLVLRVQGQDDGKACTGGSCRVSHDPPLEQRLQLGACPPNEEAKRLDATYRCISIGGQAFWRRSHADDPAGYFPE